MTVKVPNGVYSNEKQNIKRAEGNFNYRMGKAGDCFIRIYWMRYQRKFPLSTQVTRSELYSDLYISVQFTQSCPALCDPMNCSTPGFPVHHQLPEFTQTHVHRVGDAIQPSHLRSSPSPPVPNPSQHQSLFQ